MGPTDVEDKILSADNPGLSEVFSFKLGTGCRSYFCFSLNFSFPKTLRTQSDVCDTQQLRLLRSLVSHPLAIVAISLGIHCFVIIPEGNAVG